MNIPALFLYSIFLPNMPQKTVFLKTNFAKIICNESRNKRSICK